MTRQQEPRPVRFLLVEDDQDHAELVRLALAENRIANELDHVTDGELALRYLRNQPPFQSAPRPDILLLDLKLPRVDGHEVIREVKHDADLKRLPIVVLTTSDAESDRVNAYNEHVNSYLVKPVDFERFHEMIRTLGLYWTVWNQPPR